MVPTWWLQIINDLPLHQKWAEVWTKFHPDTFIHNHFPDRGLDGSRAYPGNSGLVRQEYILHGAVGQSQSITHPNTRAFCHQSSYRYDFGKWKETHTDSMRTGRSWGSNPGPESRYATLNPKLLIIYMLVISEHKSAINTIRPGVPQGSILGPFSFF